MSSWHYPPVQTWSKEGAPLPGALCQGFDLALEERRRGRTRRQGPELEMLQDPADSLRRLDEGDDLRAAAAIGAGQGIDLVRFLNQPGPGPAAFPAEVPAEVPAVGVVAPAISATTGYPNRKKLPAMWRVPPNPLPSFCVK